MVAKTCNALIPNVFSSLFPYNMTRGITVSHNIIAEVLFSV